MESTELLTILEQLERDKGIDKEVLINAVETAVASAAKKLWTVDKDEDIKVVLDVKTGKIIAYAGDEEIRSEEFGRIAAQTAKQVVIQKIREAEKDVVFDEYQQRKGEIISGSVYRFDKGNIIVDLGKAEAFIPRKEQSQKEEFRQGDRVRAYVLEVKRETRGPQIVLSRAHHNFVKRLFELEVPEIFEGIVEIKAISRDVGDRTKISVYSKDEKIDCVGACVGMRGGRVKNIVTELQGEKIDIVRYSSDIKEYIQAALSPAEISQIQLDYEGKKANIIVADDQLSLAIGKKGQNVRLASQLVGWELELFSFTQWKQLQEEIENEENEEITETAESKDENLQEAAVDETGDDKSGSSLDDDTDEGPSDDAIEEDLLDDPEEDSSKDDIIQDPAGDSSAGQDESPVDELVEDDSAEDTKRNDITEETSENETVDGNKLSKENGEDNISDESEDKA